jgi:3-oxoacyl-[acyl-carrier protein] reductase
MGPCRCSDRSLAVVPRAVNRSKMAHDQRKSVTGRLQGRTALITGSGSGLGRAYALAFAAEGAHLLIQDIAATAAEATAADIHAGGGAAETVICDIADAATVSRLFAGAERKAGAIDVLVNNAGIDAGRLFEEIDEAEFDRMFAVHVKGTFFATRAVVPGMKTRRRGKIVNISSINGMIADSTDSHYSAAKAAILGLTRAWAKELAPFNVTVNALAPGHVVTAATRARGMERMKKISAERIPLGRYAEPEEIAHAAVFLASSESDFITGQTLSPNGGEAIVGI